ncbi:MAG: prolyl oligopeptidase family serine peptidase [Gemmatimonadaceae bacterium]
MLRRPISLSTAALLSAASFFSARVTAQDRPLVAPKDFSKWESLGQTRLSPNGNWLAMGISRGNEENELRIRGGANDTTIVVAYGTQPAFTPDSKWVGYMVGIAPKERDKLIAAKKPVHNSFAMYNLATGESFTVADVASFSLSGDGRFVAMSRYSADGKRTQDVLLQELSKGTRLMFSNVAEQAWNDTKPLFAFTVAVDGGAGNGVQLFDGNTSAVRVLESSTSAYHQLAWRPKSDDIMVMRAKLDKEFSDTAFAIVAWANVNTAGATPKIFDGSTGVPTGMRVTDYRRPQWSKDGNTIYIGLRNRDAVVDAIKKSEDKVSDVEIWHPNDIHLIPEQRSNENRELHSTNLAAWPVGSSKITQIANEQDSRVAVLEGDRYATETDEKPYPFGAKFGRNDEDVWLIDLSNGKRQKVLEKVRFFYGADPTGKRLSWFDGKDYWIMDVTTRARTNVTAKLTGAQKIDFVDRGDDHPNNVLPSNGAPVWSKDGMTMLVSGEYDLWSLALDGSGGKRLTDGAKDGTIYRTVSTGGFNATAADRAFDSAKPMYLTMFGRKTKKSGYAKLAPNGPPQSLIYADAAVAGFAKADSAEKYTYTRQRFDESPNVFMADADLANGKAMSNTNAFQKDYAWGKTELMNYTSAIGVPLQAILYYPANYDARKKYPMIVYTYELLSQGINRYIVPRENDYYNANVFTQNGYFVLMPDIVFRPREPGIAVLHSVEPAVRAVIKRGLIDSARVGHAGHSQGGYEAAYLATHSKLFATAVMGSGISDMISFAGQMHWTSVPEFSHWETGQFRMQVAPWEDMPAMVKNSPLDKINEMPAKSVLVEIGGEDPTVDMRQGVEFYNYARRAGKNVVMLLYPGEGHSLGKKENAIDYERRILQWFGHYLKGEPAAKWITDGQTWQDRKKVLDANK